MHGLWSLQRAGDAGLSHDRAPARDLRIEEIAERHGDGFDRQHAIAALFRTLARRVFLKPWLNADLTAVSRAIIVENKWRAQRYGIHGTFIDQACPRRELQRRVMARGRQSPGRYCSAAYAARIAARSCSALFQ